MRSNRNAASRWSRLRLRLRRRSRWLGKQSHHYRMLSALRQLRRERRWRSLQYRCMVLSQESG